MHAELAPIVVANTPQGALRDASARFFSEDAEVAAAFDGPWFQAQKTEPTVFEFAFKASLDAPQFVFVTWRDGGWELWEPARSAVLEGHE